MILLDTFCINRAYPIFTYEDGTEVTASKPDNDGKVLLYVERFDTEQDSFVNATIILPDNVIKSSIGFSDRELHELLEEYAVIKDDIISYVREREAK